ncbi:leukemia NUP98 fusion partner 1 isoform X1 [Oreochromis niloticus]|uniref:leukemia NUP98 fusion partner 1 isoform X1 n=1 Tax=Oreochromis niloticus TaxID=8128 RepID=UPI0003940B64|nr:leukemia NUP98 fusion partner 1 isoform X1 [Oreochromis niloticus]
MSLRLLPAIIMDNDEDDDSNFTKWMSSYWGHGPDAVHSRERKRSFRRPSKTQVDRRASLPTASQLDVMKLNRFHAATMAPTPSHVKSREDKGETRVHQRPRRASADDNNRAKTAIAENRITTIPELTETLEKRLFLNDKKTTSLKKDDTLCLICHEDMRKNGRGVPHCTHRFHKEAARRLEQCRPRSSSEAAVLQGRKLYEERRRSADGQISTEKEQHTLHRQHSLRRHR